MSRNEDAPVFLVWLHSAKLAFSLCSLEAFDDSPVLRGSRIL